MTNYLPEAGHRAPVAAQPEAQRNALLRRADWRFLLGAHAHRSICFAGGRLAQAVAAISKQVIEPANIAPGECDLAVAVDPDAATLRLAWSALRPGGTYYGEYYSPFMGGAAALRRRLEAAGFTEVACYWPWPLPDWGSPLFWLPVESPQALRYFLSTRPRAPSLRRRALNLLLQPIWRFGSRAGFLAPLCVAARRPADDQPTADGDLHHTIRSNWTSWGLGAAPHQISWLLLTGGRSSRNKVVGLVFPDADPRPKMIVKLPRLPESAAALGQEAATLRRLQVLHPGGLVGVPQVVFFHDCAGQVALGETALTGQPLFTLLQRDNFQSWAQAVTDWLAELAGHAPAQPRSEWWPRLVEPALTDFEHSFGPVIEQSRVRETRAILSTLGDLPAVPEQRDFSPWNVLIGHGGELAVLDWESAEPNGLPALDLIYFLTYWAFFLDGAMKSRRFGESYRTALDPATFTGSILADCQKRYAARLGLDPAALRPLRLLAWLIHSRSEYRQLAAEVAGPPAPAALRRALFFSLWSEELACGHAPADNTAAIGARP